MAPGVFKPGLEYFGVVITGVVEEDVDRRHGRVVALRLFQLFQHGPCRLGIDLLAFHESKLERFKIKRALNVQGDLTEAKKRLQII